jgi:hypothetical protein
VGSSPYVGEVPLCAEVVLKGNDWTEKVAVTPKWHEVVQKTHRLQHTPENVIVPEDATRAKAQAAYDELDGKSSPNVGESIPANVEKEEKIAQRVVRVVGAVMVVTGGVLAIVGNNQAKDARKKDSDSEDGFQKRIDDAKTGQRIRAVGIGLTIAGAVGIGLGFAF